MQLELAAEVLRSGCLAGEGLDGDADGGSGGDGDPGESPPGAGPGSEAAADATAVAAPPRRRPGCPNQAMFFGELPAWAQRLIGLVPLSALLPPHLAARSPAFDQAILNLYRPGEGITPHVDLARFQDGIVGASLGGPVVMHFTKPRGGIRPGYGTARDAGCGHGRSPGPGLGPSLALSTTMAAAMMAASATDMAAVAAAVAAATEALRAIAPAASGALDEGRATTAMGLVSVAVAARYGAA
ncbi:hypothetical protein GPECTOR_31g400 [Gonium pectorale]|uniref:Alpha-ketoglutarate-dependent dioxygenase AlkB-like domain-containing protein n=1 Tax=Gonium pectorale TaxID=33097 RepID=A0A150GDX9_GONPE|nr:hypothetical protein GPECTOR_31g400 [Gonium pectorale]|eukprot:KXZ48036.1 hypothetical protein GPECTOR_31g400 [Gonium pectorale]